MTPIVSIATLFYQPKSIGNGNSDMKVKKKKKKNKERNETNKEEKKIPTATVSIVVPGSIIDNAQSFELAIRVSLCTLFSFILSITY